MKFIKDNIGVIVVCVAVLAVVTYLKVKKLTEVPTGGTEE